MSGEIIHLSAEDRYSLIDMSSRERLFPHPFTLGNLGMAMAELTKDWEFLWDFRKSEKVYNDIRDAYEEAHACQANRLVVLASPEQFEEVQYSIKPETARIVKMRPKSLPTHPFDLTAFADEAGDFVVNLTEEDLNVVAPRPFDTEYYDAIDSMGMASSPGEISGGVLKLLNGRESQPFLE